MITSQEIIEILNNLTMYNDKKPYLSEAQFQFELAWELQKRFKTAKILLEYTAYSIEKDGKRKRFESDIIVKFENNTYIAIELKYKTSKAEVNGVSLVQQAGQPGTKYDYLWDIHRIELLSKNGNENLLDGNCLGGYAIFLTNDSSYWAHSSGSAYNFRLCDNRRITPDEKICWNVSDGKIKEWMSRKTFSFFDSYDLKWETYLSYSYKNKEKEFKFLLTPVGVCKNDFRF